MKPAILFCSVGRRARLLMNAKVTLRDKCTLITTDNNPTAPALYSGDVRYVVSSTDSPE
jgi:carbamoyl-phosphate synthase large subunit